MSKNLAVKEETSTALVVMDDILEDAENNQEVIAAEDMLIPYLSLTQGLSKKVQPGPEKIPGLEVGDFRNTATNAIYKPGEFRIVPCGFRKVYEERIDDGVGQGRRVASHEDKAVMDGATKNDKGKFILPNKNVVEETHYHYVLVVPNNGDVAPAVISLSGSQLSPSRTFNTLRGARKIKNKKGEMVSMPPASQSFAVKYVPKKNDKGSWLVWDFSDPQPVSDKMVYAMGKAFYTEFSKGTVKVAEPVKEDVVSAETEHF